MNKAKRQTCMAAWILSAVLMICLPMKTPADQEAEYTVFREAGFSVIIPDDYVNLANGLLSLSGGEQVGYASGNEFNGIARFEQ